MQLPAKHEHLRFEILLQNDCSEMFVGPDFNLQLMQDMMDAEITE